MSDWIKVPNRNYDSIPQGTSLSKNPKDYVSLILKEEKEQAKDVGLLITEEPKQTRVKLNDVSEVLKKKGA